MSNPYLAPQIVTPYNLNILNMTNSCPMIITVEQSNTYVVGQLVHTTIPETYGMQQANDLTLQIMAIDGLDLTVELDSSQFDAFTLPSDYQYDPAYLSPAGSRNLQYNNFTNKVPFQAESNSGN